MSPNVGSIKLSRLLFFGHVVISDLYLFKDIVLLNPCFKDPCFDVIVYRQWLSGQSLALFIWIGAPVVNVSELPATGGLTSGLAGTATALIFQIFLDHDKSSSFLQLVKEKSWDLQNFLNILMK